MMFLSYKDIDQLAEAAEERGSDPLVGKTFNLVSYLDLGEDEDVIIGIPIRILEITAISENALKGYFATLVGNSGVYMRTQEITLISIEVKLSNRKISEFPSVALSEELETVTELLNKAINKTNMEEAIAQRAQISTLH